MKKDQPSNNIIRNSFIYFILQVWLQDTIKTNVGCTKVNILEKFSESEASIWIAKVSYV